jgi:hypothetical protein
MVKNGEPEVTLAEGDLQGLDGGGYQDVDAVVKLLVIDDIKGPKVRDLEACPPRVSPPRSHVSTLYSCSPVLLYAHTHAHARARAHTHSGLGRCRAEARANMRAGGGETTVQPSDCGLARTHAGAAAKCGGPSIP